MPHPSLMIVLALTLSAQALASGPSAQAIIFQPGSAELPSTQRPVLDRLADRLRQQHPEASIALVGHTDSLGSDAVNRPLSLARAETVQWHLYARGVPIGRIAVEGRGADEPVAANDSAAGRAANRRVDVFVDQAPPRRVNAK